MLRRFVSMLALLASVCACASCAATFGSGGAGSPSTSTTSPSGAPWATDTELAWTEMQRALVGRFKAETPSKRIITVSYRVVSNGSALVETFTSSSGKETISVYHHDGRALMLTHYCAQGNQARLKATVATRDRIEFAFLDATNVADQQGVMHRLVYALRPDGFDQESVYLLPSGEPESTTLRFFRTDE